MRALAILFALAAAAPAYAQQVDQTCVSRCTAQNYQYAFCVDKCSYGTPATPPVPAPIPRSNNASQVYGTIARGVQPIDLTGTIIAAENLRRQREALELQRQQIELQRQQIEAQTQQAAAQNKAAPQAQPGGGPEFSSRDQEIFRRWLSSAAQRRHLYPDFESVVFSDDLMVSMSMIELMADSPFAADIAYYLGVNKSESLRIAQLPLMDQAEAIKKIESDLAAKD